MIHAYQKPLSGKSVGIVFGSFAPLHQGHLDLIMRAKKENDGGCLVIVCGYDGDKGEPLMPHKKRYRYVREFFADDELVAVYSINDTEIEAPMYPDGWPKWMAEFERIYHKAVPETLVDCGYGLEVPDRTEKRRWYVGDETYYEALTNRFNEDCVLVDRVATNPICATMIRQNPIKHWDKITVPFRRVFSHNILICGTASEGKTTLTQDVGKYFNAPYSYEWPRKYMEDGKFTKEFYDYIDYLEAEFELARQRSELPNRPDSKRIDQFVESVNRRVVNGEF